MKTQQENNAVENFIFDPFAIEEKVKAAKAEKEDNFIFNPFGAAPVIKAEKTKTTRIIAGRFKREGQNAKHQITVDLRRMKDEMALTTRKLVIELAKFESEFGFDKSEEQGVSRDYMPINAVLMSSYLQGWVLGDDFMKAVHQRVARLYEHKKAKPSAAVAMMRDMTVKTMFEGWFNDLGIANKKKGTVPMRAFARSIAPYYKRPVTAKFDGVFALGEAKEGAIEQPYTITNEEGNVHRNVLNRAEEILVKDGATVKRGDTLQYAVLYPWVRTKTGEGRFDVSSPSEDHSTFFRWYAAKRPPRSLAGLELVAKAVAQAKAAMNSELTV